MPSRDHREGGDLCAIFVHAGAGFHSYNNEKNHLTACQDACKVAMTVLKNGGDAVDAVEMAIKVMEDREITNSGYGSNLNIDGHVECDATIVDHYGRSGAVGAVEFIKNPISLARLVLQESTRPLTLQRVPPNLLVGDGATNFAYDNHIPVLPGDYLISPGAKERWMKWKRDLERADEEVRGYTRASSRQTPISTAPSHRASPVASSILPMSILSAPTQANLTEIGTSLRPLAESAADPAMFDHEDTYQTRRTSPPPAYTPPSRDPMIDGSEPVESDVRETRPPVGEKRLQSSIKRPRLDQRHSRQHSRQDRPSMNGPSRTGDSAFDDFNLNLSDDDYSSDGSDHITDTVGAIAVDCFGNIAAGSSSGGIGMKHKGRLGPAALVGIGSAVIPADPDDASRVSVATVTSGTGEHMATTMAAATCSDRVYSCVRRKKGGGLEPASEEEAMRAMIEQEFMGHPGVKHSHCPGAIGLMSVKKTADGIFLYFAHNTDSFAIASMHSEEKKPVSVMSRNTANGAIAQGGRVARHRRR